MANLSLGVLAVLLLPVAVQGQRVWTVDQRAGQGDFTDIQSAVRAANDGDVVLVRPGSVPYAAFTIAAKGLVVVGDAPQQVAIAPNGTGTGLTNLVVTNTRADQSVVILNFAVSGFSVFPQFLPALDVSGCAGPVNVEDCRLAASPNPINSGAVVHSSGRVTLIRCTISGARMQATSYEPPPGLSVVASTLYAHDCVVTGPPANNYPSGRGGHGLEAIGSTIHADGVTLIGGQGADGVACTWVPGDGGDALFVDATSSARLRNCVLTPGAPGRHQQGCPPGRPGNRVGGIGSVRETSGPAGGSQVASPVRYGQRAEVVVTGPAGAVAWLALAPVRRPVYFPLCDGTLHVDPATAVVLPLGPLPVGGRLDLYFAVPTLAVQALPLIVQPGFLQAAAICFVGTPSELVVVDARF